MSVAKKMREKYHISERRPGELHFCVCLFVDHDASDEIGAMLGQFASDKLKEMKE